MSRSWLITGTVLYLLIGAVIAPLFFGATREIMFGSDAIGYSRGAINLLKTGFYSFDGIQPFIDREPGISVFLVPVFALFGAENPVGLVAAQMTLFFFATLFFCAQASKTYGERIAGITFFLLLTSGSVFHTIFSAYRECLALSLFLIFAGFILAGENGAKRWTLVAAGIVFAALILTYYPLMFFPPLLLIVWWSRKKQLRDLVVMLLLCYGLVSLWALRNYSYDGQFRVINNRRTAIMAYIRGEQAERVTGFEPFRCLWAEYVSRDWTGLSDACSFNAVMHVRWPHGFDLSVDYSDVLQSGKQKILAHPFSYLNFSFYEILELHVPFVGGGLSHIYNLYAAVTGLLLYAGFLWGIPALFERRNFLFTAIIAYNTLIFILTDATPRYLLPVFFCYALFAGIGYDRLLKSLKNAFCFVSSAEIPLNVHPRYVSQNSGLFPRIRRFLRDFFPE